MFYLADLARKEVFDGDASCGSNPALNYDNVTRKCAMKIDGQMFAVGKVSVGKTVAISNAVKIPTDDGAICPFGEIFVGQRVYDLNGKLLGELENAEFTPKFILKKIWVRDAEFNRGQIFSVGDAIIIRAKTPRQLLRQQRTKGLRAANQTKTAMQPAESQHAKKNTLPGTTATSPISAQPVAVQGETFEPSGQIRKRYGNFNFLLGRIVDKTIVNFQGEVMIKRAEKVTREVLRQAKISGKLIELYLHVE